ncbi:MAG: hypothetical protein IT381_18710 [Deltaproteobacteria bacterium]|nr:hypothetical protein [Deltaproteobacteria bacterium]
MTRLKPLLVAGLLAASTSCGAGPRAAPYVPSGYAETECGNFEDLAPALIKSLHSGGFDKIAEVFRTELVPSGALRTAVAAVLRLAKDAPPPDGLLTPIGKVIDNPSVEPVVTLALAALKYLAGRLPATKTHYEVTTVLSKLLGECSDPKGPLTLVEVLLKTHVPLGCTPGDDGCKLGTIALFRPLRDLLSDPATRELLSALRIEAIPEESFVVLMNQLFTILKSPSFSFTDVRAVLQANVYPLIEAASLKTKLDALLDVLDELTRPEVGLQSSLRETLTCATAKDPNGDVNRMIYALVVQPEFQVSELVSAVNATDDIDPDEKVAKWLAKVIGILKADRALNDALIGVVVKMLQERNAAKVIPSLLDISASGALADLQRLLERGFSKCSRLPKGAPPT